MNERTKCNICNAKTIHNVNEELRIDGSIQIEEYNYCQLCKHFVRGSIRIEG